MRTPILLLISAMFILTGCPSYEGKALKSFKQNGMDFANWEPHKEIGLAFNIPKNFSRNYYTDIHLSKNNGVAYTSENHDFIFAIEIIPTSLLKKAKTIAGNDQLSDVSAILEYATIGRAKQREYSTISEEMDLYEGTKKAGKFKVVHLNPQNYDDTYFVGAFNYKGKLIVATLAVNEEVAAFTHDDFLTFIRSIK